MNIHTPERGETESWEAYKERRTISNRYSVFGSITKAYEWNGTGKSKLGKSASKLKRRHEIVEH
jgi:hypothetical protein